jgi:5'-methylthioadenosine phosphorylase
MKIGILCGHPIKGLFNSQDEVVVDTSFGSVVILLGKIAGHDVYFINRHGKKGTLPPHRVNYRANIQALAASHVDCVISIGTVGSLNKDIAVGDFVVPDDFFDATRTRKSTFFDDQRVHVDMTDPFCPSLKEILCKSCENIKDITVHKKGVYLTTEGPRLESATEIRFYSSVTDIVGMTLVPEVVLAREKGLCFASVCVVCNMAAGLQEKLPVDDIRRIYLEKEGYLSDVIQATVKMVSKDTDCLCKKKIKDAML